MIETLYMIINATTNKQIGNAHKCPYIDKEKALKKIEKLQKENPDCVYALQEFNLDHISCGINISKSVVEKVSRL